jgi:hypothetical protein
MREFGCFWPAWDVPRLLPHKIEDWNTHSSIMLKSSSIRLPYDSKSRACIPNDKVLTKFPMHPWSDKGVPLHTSNFVAHVSQYVWMEKKITHNLVQNLTSSPTLLQS